MKKISFLVFILFSSFSFFACESIERKPLTVTFVDISGAMSTDHTIKISFAEEKDYENYYVDILVKADKEVELTLYQEFASEKDKTTLTVSNSYISLDEYKLFNLQKEQVDSMTNYSDALATNLVINSDKDATITLLAVIGEEQDGKFKQKNVISQEYKLNVLKHTN